MRNIKFKLNRKSFAAITIFLMQIFVFSIFYIQLTLPTDALNVKRERFFPKSAANRLFSNGTTMCPPTARLKRAPPVFEGPQNERQKAVVSAFRHAWAGYKKLAWGHDELLPISGKWQDPFELGLTIVDSLDTAVIMGLKTETKEGIEWIRESMNVSPARSVNVFETTIRVLGGLLSAFHLTGEEILLEKATKLGENLLPAFSKSSSPIPKSDVDLSTGAAFSPNRDLSSLAEATSLQLEFKDLSDATGDPKFDHVAFRASEHIHNVGCAEFDGLCPFYINGNGAFQKSSITMGARADSYYEYLIKQWLQRGKSIDWLKADFLESISGVRKHLYRQTMPNRFWFIGEITETRRFYPKMDHLACFLSGSFVLSHLNGLDKNGTHLEMAEKIGEICYKMYKNPTGLGPEITHFNMENSSDTTREDIFVKKLDAHSLLRPEAVEAWFYLFRATGDKKYQEWGWEVFGAIEKYARVENGYTSIDNVLLKKIRRRDKMESFFPAETLKYLYLLLADDQDILPLDRWIFNTEAHPLPIHS